MKKRMVFLLALGVFFGLCLANRGDSYTGICYAHRGASAFEPGNTLPAFHLAVEQGANGIETDIRETSDGVLVLSHDDEIRTVSGEICSIRNSSFDDLKDIEFVWNAKNFNICSLDEFLATFSGMDLQFALELKTPGLEERVVERISHYEIKEKTVVTSFQWEYIENILAIDPSIKTGYLVDTVSTEMLTMMQNAGVYEVCPKYSTISRRDVEYWHSIGLLVRPWGLGSNGKAMKKMCKMGVDGFTFNNPEMVRKYIEKNK